jgi:hypothetical protein
MIIHVIICNHDKDCKSFETCKQSFPTSMCKINEFNTNECLDILQESGTKNEMKEYICKYLQLINNNIDDLYKRDEENVKQIIRSFDTDK